LARPGDEPHRRSYGMCYYSTTLAGFARSSIGVSVHVAQNPATGGSTHLQKKLEARRILFA